MPDAKNQVVLTTGDAARYFGVEKWRIRRLLERGLLTPSARVGSYNVFYAGDLWRVQRALESAGYITQHVDESTEKGPAGVQACGALE